MRSPRPIRELIPYAQAFERVLTEKGISFSICGSVRRGAPEPKDLDYVIGPPEDLNLLLPDLPSLLEDIGEYVYISGKYGLHRLAVDGIQFEILPSTFSQWGSSVLHFTGRYDFIIRLRELAKLQGTKLRPSGLYGPAGVIASRTEREIFYALGIEPVPPAERTGEVVIPIIRAWKGVSDEQRREEESSRLCDQEDRRV